jgi:hypothetical protein
MGRLMPANQDWTRQENEAIVRLALELRANPQQSKAAARRAIRPSLDGRSEGSVEYKLENVSYVMQLLGLGPIPGYQGRPNIQLSLVPEVRRQGEAVGLLPRDTTDFDVMCVYVGEAARENLSRGLATRTWGFPRWEPVFRSQPRIKHVLLATGFNGGSPRTPLDAWTRGSINLIVCRYVGPFVDSTAPHWPDEWEESAVIYPCRFGIEPVTLLEDVPLALDGPLGSCSDAIRRSGIGSGMGKLVVRASLGIPLENVASHNLGALVPPMDDDVPLSLPARGGVGRISDSELRKAIEDRAMDVVSEQFPREAGWTLVNTSRRHPWDYEAYRDLEHIRVEVKGTTGAGTHVELTAGEIHSTTEHHDSALAVVSDISVRYEDGSPIAEGGNLRIIRPWSVDPNLLRPLKYEYRVPSIAESLPSDIN